MAQRFGAIAQGLQTRLVVVAQGRLALPMHKCAHRKRYCLNRDAKDMIIVESGHLGMSFMHAIVVSPSRNCLRAARTGYHEPETGSAGKASQAPIWSIWGLDNYSRSDSFQ